MSTPLQAGDKAPDFDLPGIGGVYPESARVNLSSLRGEKIALYFYPKDDTPGCTIQACGLRDGWAELSARARIFGVSTDPLSKHGKFIAKYELPFPLLSDEERTMVSAYGVWVEKKLYGKTYFGTERTTFVLNETGIISAVFRKVKPADHVDLLLAALS